MIVRFRVRDQGYRPAMKKAIPTLVTDIPREFLFAHTLTVGTKFQWFMLSLQANRLFFKVVATGREGTVMTVDLQTTEIDW